MGGSTLSCSLIRCQHGVIVNGIEFSGSLMEKIVIPAIIAILAWMIKNLLIVSFRAKREAGKEEMKARLREFYCPLFYWSGVALFDLREDDRKEVFNNLSKIMERAGYILPITHYYVIVKLIEVVSGQKTARPDIKSILKTRDYLYSRIEVLNIVLYRQSALYNPLAWLDWTSSIKAGARIAIDISLQIILWLSLVLFLTFVYYMILGNIAATTCLIILAALILLASALRRYEFMKSMKKKLAS